jgi:hypothetical protein
MKSNHLGAIIAVLLTAVIVGGGMYLWRERVGYSDREEAVAEVVFAYQQEVDSLAERIEKIDRGWRSRFAAVTGSGQVNEHMQLLMEEVASLRKQVGYVLEECLRAAAANPIDFYIGKLGDSLFVTHYTDPGEQRVIHLAAEALGAMGKPAVVPLISKLDSPDEYERQQALYALGLAARQENVVAITRGHYPTNPGDRHKYSGMSPVEAWKAWYQKHRAEL